MKVTREQAAANRERILDVAAKLFRERGLDGIGVADLMKDAGLTHGGFYGHFGSKEELQAEACVLALTRQSDRWRGLLEREGGRALEALLEGYLSKRHRDNPGAGCALATLGGDVARQGPAVRGPVEKGVRELFDVLARMVPGKTAAARRKKAIALYSSLVGALVIARAVEDPKLSEEIMRAAAGSAARA